MSKRINISISDELFDKLEKAKTAFPNIIKISKICQEALEQSAIAVEAFQCYRSDGIKDGKKSVKKVVSSAAIIILNHMNSYQNIKSSDGKIAALQNLESELYKSGHENYFFERFKKLMDGQKILHPWANTEDRRGESVWYYTEGWYKGFSDAYKKIENDKS